ncbi:relaxosome protein TraM [Enterobacter asburiae]
MPRAQVYISQNNYKRIQSIVDAKKEDGADRTEANISSVAAMLLDIGLRVYEFQQKKELEGNSGENHEVLNSIDVDKTLMENVLKTGYAITVLLQMVSAIKDVKEVREFSDYINVKNRIRDETNSKMNEIFKDGGML